jgi:Fe-S-cluster containining protein
MAKAPNAFVNFNCHHCNHCCTEVVCLPTPWDVRRIIMMTGEDPFDFLEFLTPPEIEGVDDDDPTWLEVRGKRYMMALQRGKKGCYFLDKKTKLCSIYTARPILCRLYPFKVIENKKGEYRGFTLHDDVGCPRHRDGQVATEPLYDLYVQDELNQEDYHELVIEFNRKKYPGKKPEDFVTLFTGGFTRFEEVMAED